MRRVLELERLREENRVNQSAIAELLSELGDVGLNFRPTPDRWSVAECLQHLDVSLELYLPHLRRVIAEGRERRTTSTAVPRAGLLGAWFLSRLEPPPRMRVRAPRIFHPRPSAGGASVTELARQSHAWRDHLDRAMSDALGLDLQRLTLRSPASALFRLSLGEAFAVLTAHDRRHLWQARQVMRSPNFPGA